MRSVAGATLKVGAATAADWLWHWHFLRWDVHADFRARAAAELGLDRRDPLADRLVALEHLLAEQQEALATARVEVLTAHTRLSAVTAALARTTDGWLRVPDFGSPHCRYCGSPAPSIVGGEQVAHAADCPVRVLAEG